MGEYDAFGRKVGEDTLEGLGGHSQSAATPVSVETANVGAAPAPARDAPEPAAGTNTPEPDVPLDLQQVGRGFASVLRWIIALVILGAIGSGVWSASDSFDTPDFDLPAISIPSLIPEPPAASAPEVPAEPPAGLERRSLIRQPAFSRALALLRSRDLGQITNLRLAADRIDVQLLTKGGRLRNVQITPGNAFRQLSLSGPGFGHVGTMAYSDVDTAAAQRLTRAAARRRGVSPTRVDYLVVGDFGGEIIWSLFFKDGAHFQADAAGKITRRL